MNKETAIINEVSGIPIISAYSAIGPHITLCRKDTHEVIKTLFSINVQTGESTFPKLDAAGQIERDEDGKIVFETSILDLNNFYLAFKTIKK